MAKRLTKKDWNNFRRTYSTLTVTEKKRLYKHWLRLYPKQMGYSGYLPYFIKYIGEVIEQTGRKELSIVEYGGHDGSLAVHMMQKYPSLRWINVDLIPHTAKEQLKNYDYREHVLEDELWIEKPRFMECDVFLSSSTLEHISDEEITQLFDYIHMQNIEYLILLITVGQKDTNWENYEGGHVLKTGSIGLKKMLINQGYNLIWENNTGKWFSFWRLRHAKH